MWRDGEIKRVSIHIAGLVAVGLLGYILGRLLSNFHWSPSYLYLCALTSARPEALQAVDSWISPAGAILLFPMLEEYIFRAWMFKLLRRRLNIGYTITISALLFSVAHYQYWIAEVEILQSVGIFASGILFGCVYAARHKMRDSVLVHGLSNALVLIPKSDILPAECLSVPGPKGTFLLAIMALVTIASIFVVIRHLWKIPSEQSHSALKS